MPPLSPPSARPPPPAKRRAQAGSGTTVLSPGEALTRRHLGRSHALMRLVASSHAARLLLAAAAGALTLGAGNSPAAVAGWTVSPGGPFTGHAGTTELADTTTGQAAIICASSLSRGTFRSGSGLPGAGIGSIAAVSFRGGCFTLTAGRLPWKVNAKSYQPATGTTVGTITGVHLRFTDPTFCNLT